MSTKIQRLYRKRLGQVEPKDLSMALHAALEALVNDIDYLSVDIDNTPYGLWKLANGNLAVANTQTNIVDGSVGPGMIIYQASLNQFDINKARDLIATALKPKIEADVDIVDENDGLLDDHQLSMEQEFPAGEGDSNRSTRPGETTYRQGHIASAESRSAILALVPTDAARKKIESAMGDRLHEEPEELHITLAYLGKGLSDEDIEKVCACLDAMCPDYDPLECRMQGLGVFDHTVDGGRPFYASIDALGMAKLRTELLEAIEHTGVAIEHKYDFTPHMTLGYVDVDLIELAEGSPGVEWVSDKIVLMNGGKHTEFKLGSIEKEAQIRPNLPDDMEVVRDQMEENEGAPKVKELSERDVYEDLYQKEVTHDRGSSDKFFQLFGPIKTPTGAVYVQQVMTHNNSLSVIFLDQLVIFHITVGSTSPEYSKKKTYVIPSITKMNMTSHDVTVMLAELHAAEESMPSSQYSIQPPTPIYTELASYLVQFVGRPMTNQMRPQIGQELHRILHFASKNAGGFGYDLQELDTPSVGGNFEQPDNQLSENTQEDPDLKLGEVEEPYAIDSGPENFRFEDSEKYNIVKGAEFYRVAQSKGWQPAFQNTSTGEIVVSPGFHDTNLLPVDDLEAYDQYHDNSNKHLMSQEYKDEFEKAYLGKPLPWIDGFIDQNGKFYDRDQANAMIGVSISENLPYAAELEVFDNEYRWGQILPQIPEMMHVVQDNMNEQNPTGTPVKVEEVPDNYRDNADGVYFVALMHVDFSPVTDLAEASRAMKLFGTNGVVQPDDLASGLYNAELPFHMVRESNGRRTTLDAHGYILDIDFGQTDTDNIEHQPDAMEDFWNSQTKSELDKQSIGLPDEGVDENKYEDDLSRTDSAIPRG